ncbi:5'-nucleotidase C-terminal domain-containing protein [Marinivivus vitaminiproducens]|uniref:5'-nucleotidase C-terminal domain-containing protein n=1 Tax=Marinivivus vitaminiproducens TaxID=3035935 RepID=UPI0027A62CC9|nr:5'-nucleotidase C-terminal domain-containing protein [Geminicoccaceae bacterium SCSIO 64248]
MATEESNPIDSTSSNGDAGTFALQLLHASDLEGGLEALERAPNFAAITAHFQEEMPATLTLSAGDNYIPGPFFSAAGDAALQPVLQDAYEQHFGLEPGSLAGLGEGEGRADITLMNLMGFQASALGNHEFDAGTNAIASIIAPEIEGDTPADVGWFGTQFPYLSTNLDFSGDASLSGLATDEILPNTAFQSTPDDLAAAAEAPKIAPATVVDVEGESIGVIGATTQNLPNLSSPGGVTVEGNPDGDDIALLADQIQESIDALEAEGIDKIVVTSHLQQIALEEELAGQIDGADIIIAGGSDSILANDGQVRPEDAENIVDGYPIVTEDAAGDPVAIVSTSGEYSYVGRLVAEFDDQGVLIADSIDPAQSGPYASSEETVAELYGEDDPFAEGSSSALVQDVVEGVQGVVNEKDGEVFGSSEVFLEGRRTEVRTEETNLGNLTADANLAEARKVDPDVAVSIKNGGGIRNAIGQVVDNGDGTVSLQPTPANPEAGKEAGDVSQLDIENSLRFNNDLSIVTVTAEQLVEAVEYGFSAVADGATPGQFPQLGGMAVSFDPDAEPGSRVQSLGILGDDGEVSDVVVRDGAIEGDAGRPIKVATLSFLAEGGDGYPFGDFAAADPAFFNRIDLAGEDGPLAAAESAANSADPGTEQDAFAEYLLANYADTPFAEADTPPAEDERIQNLAVREDTVLDGAGEGPGEPGGGDGPLELAIYDIQDGWRHRSSHDGEDVRTTGIVTAVDDVGFYLQDAQGDGKARTSDAINVYLGAAPDVAVGDEVTVEGTVSEYVPGGEDTGNLSITQIAGDVGVTVDSKGNDLPEAVVIGRDGRTPPTEVIEDDAFSSFDPETDAVDFYESLEGMRVTVADAQAVSGTNRFGEIYTVTDNGLGATGLSARGTLNIAPDDFNPERVQIQANDALLPDFDFPEVDTGARLGDVTGVMSYDFGNFEVHPTEAFEVTRESTLEPEVSELASGDGSLTVASYNVLNLDPNDGDGDRDISDDRYATLAAQIADNLQGPDIVALQEIQDDDGSIDPDNSQVTSAAEGLQLLADAIEEAGGPSYEVIDNTFIGNGTGGGQPGGNIRTAFLYNPEKVDLVEDSVRTITDPEQQQADSLIGDGEGAFDPALNPFANARLPLVADFTVEGSDDPITVVSNHFSSKSGSDPLFGANQDTAADEPVNMGVEQRGAQADAVRDFVADLLADDADARVVVAGDFNEFEFFEPLERLQVDANGERVLTNLTDTVPENERYTYNFEGNSQSLDHILVSDALFEQAEVDLVHVNSEFAETDERASDHDPVLARFDLGTGGDDALIA